MGPPVLVMWLLQNLSAMVLATRAQNAAQRSSSEAIRRVVGRMAKVVVLEVRVPAFQFQWYSLFPSAPESRTTGSGHKLALCFTNF